jgi:DNA-binding HxlR family transcriptional regulator
MEADGVVHRVSYDEVPPRVEYSLTEDGRRLNDALQPLAAWGRRRSTGRGAEERAG